MPSTYQSIIVPAPADDVWHTLRNFHDLSWAPDVVEQCEVVGDASATAIGAQRVLNGVFEETLHALDDTNRILQYSIDDGPSPISTDEVRGYAGRVEVRPITLNGASFVEWSSAWETHAEDADAEEAEEFCQTIYVALLNALKAHHS